MEVWVKELESGKETVVTPAPSATYYPRISADGLTVAYRVRESGKSPLYVVPAAGGAPERKCDDCGAPGDISPDGSELLYHLFDGNRAVGLLDLRSGQRVVLTRHPQNLIAQPHFSPDGRWIALHTDLSPVQVRLFVMPFRERALPAESEWIAITDGTGVDRDACWSPDGNLLYFFSARDGFRCLW